MKIIENHDPDGVLLKDLPSGDVFVYASSYYMKVQDDERFVIVSPAQQKVAAADLATGKLVLIPETERVPPIHARIRISGRAD